MLRALARRCRDAAPRAAPRARGVPPVDRSPVVSAPGRSPLVAPPPRDAGRPSRRALAPALSWSSSSSAATASRAPPSSSSSAAAASDDDPAAARAALRPAILVCTSKVVPKHQREDYDAWLAEGKALIEQVLEDKDCQAGVTRWRPEDLPAGRFSWVHFPADREVRRSGVRPKPDPRTGLAHVRHGGAPKTETVAVVFQRHDDLERWRRSRRREEWLRRGERFGGDGGGTGEAAWRVNARVSSIDVDDGSLGGWLPADVDDTNRRGGAGSSPTPAPSPWKVYATVVLAQYPLYELNALLFLPALDAAGAEWFAAMSQPARGLLVQSWTSAGAVFVTLPFTQGLLRRFGFMQSATRGETARGAALVAAAYAGTVAGFHLAQPAFAALVERVAT